jgi:hypothetical protein
VFLSLSIDTHAGNGNVLTNRKKISFDNRVSEMEKKNLIDQKISYIE